MQKWLQVVQSKLVSHHLLIEKEKNTYHFQQWRLFFKQNMMKIQSILTKRISESIDHRIKYKFAKVTMINYKIYSTLNEEIPLHLEPHSLS